MIGASVGVFLDSYLEPLAPYLARDDITDIYVNRPGELWIETIGGSLEWIDLPALTNAVLGRLARQIAATNAQGISREHPLLTGKLPEGSRVQIALPPATRGEVALSIRKHVNSALTLKDYAAAGSFAETGITSMSCLAPDIAPCAVELELQDFLAKAVLEQKTILISGGTSSGKTTFLNALMCEIPPTERLILIEDAPELQLFHTNAVGLLAVRGSLGEAAVTADDLLIASLRMRPDRIILGELRGLEALTFLRAVNTGHPGSLSTIHADSADRAIDQLALLALQSGSKLSWDDVVRYIRRSIDIVVQLERKNGVRRVREISMLRNE